MTEPRSDSSRDHHDPEFGDPDDLFGLEPVPEPQLVEDGIPIHGHHCGEPIPDLRRIPRERWREVLRPLRQRTRRYSLASSGSLWREAVQVVSELDIEDPAPFMARSAASDPPRMPAGVAPSRAPARQISFRLDADEYGRLCAAAELYSLRPTTLARVLTTRGVDRALYEERRSREETA